MGVEVTLEEYDRIHKELDKAKAAFEALARQANRSEKQLDAARAEFEGLQKVLEVERAQHQQCLQELEDARALIRGYKADAEIRQEIEAEEA